MNQTEEEKEMKEIMNNLFIGGRRLRKKIVETKDKEAEEFIEYLKNRYVHDE